MLGAIKYNLANLTNLHGRDARQTFWYYVLFLYIIQMVAGMLIAIPMMVEMFGQMFEGIRAGADPRQMNALMFGAMNGPIEASMWLAMGLGAASLLALAASLVRRLHDSDLSGWWSLLPGLIYLANLIHMPTQIEQTRELLAKVAEMPQPPSQLEMMQGQELTMVLAYLPIVLLVIMGVRKSSPGPNRFGDAPVSF